MRPRTILSALAAIAAIGILIVLPFGLRGYGLYVLSLWAVLSIAAMGLNLTLGYAGQVSLAQAAFVGIGAYTTALLLQAGYPFLLGATASVLLGFGVGWLLGYPALRVQHHYLAFVTLAFNTLAFLFFRNEEWLTGGIFGVRGIPRPTILGWSTGKALDFYFFCLAALAVVSLAAWWLVHCSWGRAFVALRENPLRASSLGVDTSRYTLMAFAIGSALGSAAGSLYAPLLQYIDPNSFTVTLSLNLLLMVVVGGAGYFAGPFVGALIAVLVPEWLRFTQDFYLMFYAALVILVMAVFPTGLLGLAERLAGRKS